MVRYLLDTNILSDVIKNPQNIVAKRIATMNNNEILTSIIVASELRYGAAKKGSIPLTERVNTILTYLTVMPLDIDADYHYGQLRMQLEARGEVIGANDLLIAAHALAIDAVLVTDNTKEFERIHGLKVENWLRE